MKRASSFRKQLHIKLELPLAELKVLLGDDDGLIECVCLGVMRCPCCGLSADVSENTDIYIDDDSCLFLSQNCRFCQQEEIVGFLDTSDLPDWQYIIRHLVRQQFGMNSLGDE